jgi:hypothetical protein
MEDRARLVNLFLALESSGASRILQALDVAAASGDETAVETHKRIMAFAVKHGLANG